MGFQRDKDNDRGSGSTEEGNLNPIVQHGWKLGWGVRKIFHK